MRENFAKWHDLELRARKTIREHQMLSEGDRVLIGISGGADSTALLLCLRELAAEFRITLVAAHLNHGIRGTEADEDEAFVRKMCSDFEIPFYSEKNEIKREAEANKKNLEEFARQKRYEFLQKVANETSAQKIAVGHNLNDQAETVLFRFLRGSGIEGFAAIHPVVSGKIIRPLIDCARALITDYLQFRNIGYREDSTNADTVFARNRIRRQLIPYLEKNFNPQLITTLSREAGLARETWSFIESSARQAFISAHRREGASMFLDVPKVIQQHQGLQKEILRVALKECLGSLRGIESVHIHNLLSLFESNRSGDRINLPGMIIAERQFGEVILRKIPGIEEFIAFSYTLPVPGRCCIPEARISFSAEISEAPSLEEMRKKQSTQAFIATSAELKHLVIRSRAPGDRYGGKGHRKVKKMLIDSKIPLQLRSAIPMAAIDSVVIWIPGFKPAVNYEAKPGAARCVVIKKENDC
jgi:tRNA(Ile)-lysidine synthase